MSRRKQSNPRQIKRKFLCYYYYYLCESQAE